MVAVLLILAFLARPAASREALEERFRTIADSAGGTVGVSVLHLESGRGASLHGNERFPMASVFKLAVMIKGSDRDLAAREKAIAAIARAAYDYWMR